MESYFYKRVNDYYYDNIEPIHNGEILEQYHIEIDKITLGDLVRKPGWIRMSIHPTTTTEEIQFVCDSIKSLAESHLEWSKDYKYESKSNEFVHKQALNNEMEMVKNWFKL